ncbi:hypothetical protein KM043_012026 [Ampulex compressa]|nr:hypothetical protein KM043_012026 [Ampulex compressa]
MPVFSTDKNEPFLHLELVFPAVRVDEPRRHGGIRRADDDIGHPRKAFAREEAVLRPPRLWCSAHSRTKSPNVRAKRALYAPIKHCHWQDRGLGPGLNAGDKDVFVLLLEVGGNSSRSLEPNGLQIFPRLANKLSSTFVKASTALWNR